jgi:hypothetical protein
LRSAIHNGIRHQKEALCRRLSDFRDYVQLPILLPDSRPNATTVLSFLCILISFVMLLCVGAKLPVKSMWIIILALGGTCSIVLPIRYFMSRQANRMFLLFLCSVYSIINQYIGGHIYRANLGNTITIVLLTIPTFTILYARLWYPARSTEILTSSTDSVV